MNLNSIDAVTCEGLIRKLLQDEKLYAMQNQWGNYVVVMDRDGIEVASLDVRHLHPRDFRQAVLYIERQVRDYKWTRDIWSGRKHVCL